MIDDFRHLRLEHDGRGVATVWFDVQGVPVNVFNDEVVGELQEVVGQLERQPPRVVVFRSAKMSGFLAGADLRRIQQIQTADEVRMVLRAGHELFDRIEQLPCPTIAVIHGPCLGGGLEFALACRYRVARDDAQTRIGLPEVQLGLIPGWGGTQRLPRVVGLRQALRMILEGATLSAAKALTVGLVDLAAPTGEFDAEVERFINDRLAGRSLRRRTRGLVGAMLDGTWPGRTLVFATARKQIRSRSGHYPALPAAIRAVAAGFRGTRTAGFAVEREEFTRVVFTPSARNLIEVFFQRERARKRSTWVPDEAAPPHPLHQAAIIGAGTMGAGIAQLLAFNGIPVVLKDVSDEIVAGGVKRIETLTGEAVSKGLLSPDEASALVRRVTPAGTDWSPLADADLVIEAVVEREEIKREVFRQLGDRLSPAAVLASNTSALSVSRLAEATRHPERVAGLHFFNPVHRMQLVEVVRGLASDDSTVAVLVDLVRRLGKVPVVVADSPGFLVNRLLFPYLDEAVRLVIEGVPGPDIDREATRFGMPMGPFELLDQIGVDIAADVSGTFAPLRTEPGPTPERFAAMVREGWCGKKSGHGFYEYRNGRRGKPTKWATPSVPRPSPASPTDETGGLTALQQRLIFPIINEAAKCLEAGIVTDPWIVDLAMVLGTGFAPFRGGPLRTADALGVGRVVRALDSLSRESGDRFEPAPLLRTLCDEQRGFYAAMPAAVVHEEVHQ
jgi:3-hydroxyacyl-CoA dehydrogenase/enoyl-CoA hydratase/3-hydroxybutyryl-CoA epimerase